MFSHVVPHAGGIHARVLEASLFLTMCTLVISCGGSSDASSTQPSSSSVASAAPSASASASIGSNSNTVAPSAFSAQPMPGESRPSVIAAHKAEEEMMAKLALDEVGRASWKRAESAWVTYLLNDAMFVLTVLRDNSAHAPDAPSVGAKSQSRIKLLDDLVKNKDALLATKGTSDELIRAEDRLASLVNDPESKRLYGEAKAAWLTYRNEEMTLVRRALSKALGSEDNAIKALDAALDQQRISVVSGESTRIRNK